jgi:LmbE family N-acetylglucosaminyl deacetylase
MGNSTRNNHRTLLAALAHPDDESFGMGGTLALYAKKGVAVHLVCATRGEVGEVEPRFLENYRSIAELREAELRCAAGMLGLTGVHFLGYRDSGMTGSPENEHPEALANAPVDEVAERISCHIRRLRPQVVLTFDPIGGYRHPDHIAIHRATVKAFHAAGDPQAYPGEYPPYHPQKLYFHTFPRRMLRWAVRLMPLFGKDPHRFGLNGDVDLVPLAEVDFPVHARINYKEVLDLKEAASACHASQGAMGVSSGLMRFAFRRFSGIDQFMRAFPPPEPGLRERDLFANLQPEEIPNPVHPEEVRR